MIIRIYLKRKRLIEKDIEITSEVEIYLLKFLLKAELDSIKSKLKILKDKGLIKNISLPGKTISDDLVKSRSSILRALEKIDEMQTQNMKGGNTR